MRLLDFFRRLQGRKKPASKEPQKEQTPAPSDRQETDTAEEGLLAVTCIGYSHIKHGTVCQDSSLCHRGPNFRFMAVSDGHGSENFLRSDRGSRLACQAALEACTQLTQAGFGPDREQTAKDLCRDILSRWKAAVEADHAGDPFEEQSLQTVSEKYRDHYRNGRHVAHAYGATLIAALELGGSLLVIRCGDGECMTIDPQGRFAYPVSWNEKCDVNITTSLCDPDALEEFRWGWVEQTPAALWMGTDGVDNSYPVVEDLQEFYANLSRKLLEKGKDYVTKELEDFLPELTRRCSRDDLSVAAMWNREELAQASPTLQDYLQLRLEARNHGELQRRLKNCARMLREQEKALARAQKAEEETICRKMDALRQQQAELEAQICEKQSQLQQLQARLGTQETM